METAGSHLTHSIKDLHLAKGEGLHWAIKAFDSVQPGTFYRIQI